MISNSELKAKMLELLEKDEEFRYAIAGKLGLLEILKRMDRIENELRRLREDFSKRFEAIERKLLEYDKRFEAIERRLEEHSKRLEELTRTIQALGCRWGIFSEEAFREGMRSIVEKLLGVGRVERWVYVDREGYVYGYPSVVEVDLVIRDKEHILIEVKSSTNTGDVLEFKKIGELYEKVTGVKPRLVIVTPYAYEKAKEIAKALGIEVYERVS